MDKTEENSMRSEITAIEQMLCDLPEWAVIDRLSLESRKQKIESELAMECGATLLET